RTSVANRPRGYRFSTASLQLPRSGLVQLEFDDPIVAVEHRKEIEITERMEWKHSLAFRKHDWPGQYTTRTPLLVRRELPTTGTAVPVSHPSAPSPRRCLAALQSTASELTPAR